MFNKHLLNDFYKMSFISDSQVLFFPIPTEMNPGYLAYAGKMVEYNNRIWM